MAKQFKYLNQTAVRDHLSNANRAQSLNEMAVKEI